MPAVQRNGPTKSPTNPPPSSSSKTSNNSAAQPLSSSSPTMSPPRPTPYLLLVYPLILAIGSLYSAISPVAVPAAPLAQGMTSGANAPAESVNYFAGKRNLVNILFVKRGWLWTSLAFLFLQLTIRPAGTTSSQNKNKHYVQSAIRYGLVTLAWIFTTQWLFGPALIDRSFTLTGGVCEGLPATLNADEQPLTKLATVYSSTACKRAGGRWHGGHDISGHVFMLALSSAFLLYELYLADRASSHPSVSPRAAANVAHDMTEEEKRAVGGWESAQAAKSRIYARYFLYAVVALDCLMLFTTAVWFHTWLEKVNGMLIAGLSLWVTYFLGDFVPGWRAVVGGL